MIRSVENGKPLYYLYNLLVPLPKAVKPNLNFRLWLQLHHQKDFVSGFDSSHPKLLGLPLHKPGFKDTCGEFACHVTSDI